MTAGWKTCPQPLDLAMTRFLFLNDTSGDYHFGCTCTSDFDFLADL